MPTAMQYYQSMTRRDVQTFLSALGTTLLLGGALLYFLFRGLNKYFASPKPVTTIPRSSGLVGGATEGGTAASAKKKTNRSPTPPPVPGASLSSSDTAVGGGAAGAAFSSEEGRRGCDHEARGGDAHPPSRHIPRAAQSALIQRGCRQLEEENYTDALTSFLSVLRASVDSKEKALPAHLTDCLRGVGKSYLGLGQPEAAVQFLQAERLVFEEMVVQAANPSGGGPRNGTSIIASLLRGKAVPSSSADRGTAASQPRRCATLSEVADACGRLGHPEIELAYRIKAAALKQRISGDPLSADSEDAVLLAQALNGLQERRSENRVSGDDVGGPVSRAAAASRRAPPRRGEASGAGGDEEDEDNDAMTSRREVEAEILRRLERDARMTDSDEVGGGDGAKKQVEGEL